MQILISRLRGLSLIVAAVC